MAEKVKILKKDVPFLRKDLELEADVVEKLLKLQAERQKEIQDKIETTQKEALERYAVRIKMLEEAKAQAVKQYDEEIKKYQELLKGLQAQVKKASPKPVRAKVKEAEK